MAAWIQGERKRLGLSTKQLSERLALIGVTVGEQTISVWESYAGRNPSAQNIDALERLFGSQAPDQPAEQGDMSALIAAIREQTRAMDELVKELRAAREVTPDVRAEVAELKDYAARHEVLFQADRRRLGLEPEEDPPLESAQAVAGR